MDTESFVLSIRERRPIWDQQIAEHHNRYILDRLWKEISKEYNCSVKEAQKKWKGLRDYYRAEFRKTQKERSGQGADTLYKSNWPFYMTLDFLREQFQARPSSGNITREKRKADISGLAEVSDNDHSFLNDEQGVDYINHTENEPTAAGSSAQNETGGSICTTPVASTSTPVASSSTQYDRRGFTHSNEFPKKKSRQDQIQRLVQLEEKKVAILEERKQNKLKEKEKNYDTDDEDSKFFESLQPHLKLINGVDKLMFRNEVQNLVMKYAYFNRESSTPRSGQASGSSRAQTPNNQYNITDLDQGMPAVIVECNEDNGQSWTGDGYGY